MPPSTFTFFEQAHYVTRTFVWVRSRGGLWRSDTVGRTTNSWMFASLRIAVLEDEGSVTLYRLK